MQANLYHKAYQNSYLITQIKTVLAQQLTQ